MAVNLLMFDSRSTISGLNQCVNTWHIRTSGAITATEVTNLMVPFKTFWDNLATYRSPGTVTITGSRILLADISTWVKPVGSPGKPGYVGGYWSTPPLILAGTPSTSTAGSAASALPPQLASVISWRTAIAGRTGRGRTYVGNLGNTAQQGASVNAAYVTAVNTQTTTLINAVPAVSVASGVVGITIWSPTNGYLHDVISGASDATFDTMRSRVK